METVDLRGAESSMVPVVSYPPSHQHPQSHRHSGAQSISPSLGGPVTKIASVQTVIIANYQILPAPTSVKFKFDHFPIQTKVFL